MPRRTLWIPLLALIAGAAGCSQDDSGGADEPDASDRFSAHDEYAPSPENGLTFTRSGGSTYEIHEGVVECGPDGERRRFTGDRDLLLASTVHIAGRPDDGPRGYVFGWCGSPLLEPRDVSRFDVARRDRIPRCDISRGRTPRAHPSR